MIPCLICEAECGRPTLLDAFCGAGGAACGYRDAGFCVLGVDHEPQPRYVPRGGCRFVLGDALEYVRAHGHEFDAIHASPPCQAYSTVGGRARKGVRGRYPDLLLKTQAAVMLVDGRSPRVIENVEGARRLMRFPVRLCGSAFGLDVRRHRYFESNVLILAPECVHQRQRPRFRSLDSRSKTGLASVIGVHGHFNYAGERALREQAMGIDWMEPDELNEAIPPAYTFFLGTQLLAFLAPEA